MPSRWGTLETTVTANADDRHVPQNPVRFVTAASLFDGHDASINIMRRILQSQGAEVVHLGHNRSVDEVVDAAVAEDVQGIALSSYQGGHVEYFEYLVDRLREEGVGHVRVYGGGGGVIVPEEIDRLHAYGVTRIFSPQDGQRMGLVGMINSMIAECDVDLAATPVGDLDDVFGGSVPALARLITRLEAGVVDERTVSDLAAAAGARRVPVLGITGTGGSGKSSLTDELVRRIRLDQDDKVRVAVVAIDPTRRRGGGALLGDRIRMNAIATPQVYFRSLATRSGGSEVPDNLGSIIDAAKAWGADLVIVETPGIGQGDAAIVPFSDVSLYVMTPEFGASSQLEKIDMLDFADAVAINKFERRGAADAQRDVSPSDGPQPRGVRSSTGGHAGVRDGGLAVQRRWRDRAVPAPPGRARPARLANREGFVAPGGRPRLDRAEPDHPRVVGPLPGRDRGVGALVPPTDRRAVEAVVRRQQQLEATAELMAASDLDPDDVADLAARNARGHRPGDGRPARRLARAGRARCPVPIARPASPSRARWCRASRCRGTPTTVSSCGSSGARTCPGRSRSPPGCSRSEREDEDPARMFAGEGGAARTNRRFHMLADGQRSTRLSTAFDSVTLYGFDPAERPDIYGKVGNSGVSIATLDDMEVLYSGFDLCDPSTSVSMTINGPAPTILAMFLNTAIDQRIDRFEQDNGRPPTEDEAIEIRRWVLANVRGTVQADILKEDQGQNTCIFSTEFSLAVMGDIAEWFVEQRRPRLLLGLDLGLPHRGSGREPDQPAGVHALERVHLRRVVPGPRARHR